MQQSIDLFKNKNKISTEPFDQTIEINFVEFSLFHQMVKYYPESHVHIRALEYYTFILQKRHLSIWEHKWNTCLCNTCLEHLCVALSFFKDVMPILHSCHMMGGEEL